MCVWFVLGKNLSVKLRELVSWEMADFPTELFSQVLHLVFLNELGRRTSESLAAERRAFWECLCLAYRGSWNTEKRSLTHSAGGLGVVSFLTHDVLPGGGDHVSWDLLMLVTPPLSPLLPSPISLPRLLQGDEDGWIQEIPFSQLVRWV